MKHQCPVCGFDSLQEAPRSLSGGSSYEICPVCGFQFGESDEDKGFTYDAWRDGWKKRGMPWSSKQPMPANWNAAKCVLSVTPHPGAKRIIVTGGTRGCGAALVETFAKAGHIVIACGRGEDGVSGLRKKFSAPHDFTAVDVADDEAVGRWAARVITTHGAPDILVNNAGVIASNAPLWKVADAEVVRVLDVNVRGTTNTIRHFLPAMIASNRGLIVNFSSGWGRSTSPEVAIYCASKFAVEGLTQALAQELPKGLAAVALNPGIINTEMLRSCFGESAIAYPKPDAWAKAAAPFILALSAKDNGCSLDLPEASAT